MSVINTNVNAIIAQNAGVKNSRMQTQAMQQLSTGNRINSAADDAAGLAISSKMTAQIRGLNQAVRNANDGISLIQTAEGALTEVNNMLQRMRELAVQSASDTNTDSDRTALNAEFSALRDEINRIGNNTQFNGMNVLNGQFAGNSTNGAVDYGKFIFQVGANAAQTIDITLGDYRTNGGTGAVTQATTNTWTPAANTASEAGTLTLTVGGYSAALTVTGGETAADQVTSILANTTFTNALGAAGISITNGGTSLSFTKADGTAVSATFTDTTTTAEGSVGQSTRLTFDGTYAQGDVLKFTLDNGNTLSYTVSATDVANRAANGDWAEMTATIADTIAAANNGGTFTETALVAGGGVTAATNSSVSYTANNAYLDLVGAAGTTFTVTVAVNGSSGGDLAMINSSAITSQNDANSAVNAVDSAIAVVSGGRATMGATINRLNYAADNLLATSANVSASRSRIQDTDYSQATTELARTQIIQQASTAMLAQANQSAQSVLSLLK